MTQQIHIHRMLTITKKFKFEACHKLKNYSGPCANMHGHSYFGECTFLVTELDDIGMGMDFSILKEKINSVVDKWDHQDLTNMFGKRSATVEVMVMELFRKITEKMVLSKNFVYLYKVKLHETVDSYAEYTDVNLWNTLM